MNEFELHYYYRQNPHCMFSYMLDYYDRLIYGAIHMTCFSFDPQHFMVDDCYQEACLALVRALDRYREDVKTTFASYLYQSVVSSVRRLSRDLRTKKSPYSDMLVSLDYPIVDDHSMTMLDVIAQENQWYQPQWVSEFSEVSQQVCEYIENLDDLDKRVYALRAQGKRYMEVAESVGISAKKVDNILQKVRKQIKQFSS